MAPRPLTSLVATLVLAGSAVVTAPATAERAAPDDTTKPVLVDFSLSPSSVDTTRHAATVTVRATVTDTGSGVDKVEVRGPDPALGWISSSIAGFGGYGSRDLQRIGDSDVFTGTLRVPTHAGDRDWKLSLRAADVAGNLQRWGRPVLADRGGVLAVTSQPRDHTAPHLGPVTLPSKIDVRDGDVRFRVTAHGVRDGQSGVRRVYAFLRTPDGTSELELHSTGGGTWTARARVGDRTPAGPMRWHVFVVDRQRNIARAKGDIAVRNRDVVGPYVTSRHVAPSGAVTLDFNEGVLGIATDTVRVSFWDTSTEEYVPIAGSWTCTDRSEQPVACSAGPSRHATYTPSGDGPVDLVDWAPDDRQDVVDRHGNPMNPTTFEVHQD